MNKAGWLICFLMAVAAFPSTAQRIVYSEPEKDDTRRLDFEIVGKVGGNFLIYKNIRNRNYISVLNNDMVQTAKVELDYVPDNDRMINVDFFPYGEFSYMIYQYQKKNIVYCMVSMIGGNGQKIGGLTQLDTTQIGFSANNRIYTVLTSEDKSKIAIFKINSKNRKMYMMTSILMDDKLNILNKNYLGINMEERNDHLSDFQLDNEGDIVFTKFIRGSNDNISKAALVVKHAQSDTLMMKDLDIEKKLLDEIHIKIDNYNKRYFLTSFYYQERRGNIEGYYFYVWNKITSQPVIETTTAFSEELRRDAKGDASIKTAFDDYFIKNIITRRDGGFIIGSEAYYTTSRFNSWNRWNYLYGSPFRSPYTNYYYSPYTNSYWWNSRAGSGGQAMRYHADNITVMSFDKNGKQEWNNVIGKTQFNDESDDQISYQLMNTGDQLHFLFNQQERRNNLLSDFSITPEGKMTRNPTLKNLDKGYEFMPMYGKQISSKQMIIPCMYRNYICFAKLDYN